MSRRTSVTPGSSDGSPSLANSQSLNSQSKDKSSNIESETCPVGASSSRKAQRLSLYKVTLNIIGAENLRVADIFSSDPYCVVTVGGKPIGQTAVVPSTLSPVWNHTFEIELLHLETPILLELFDEDDMKVDEALGRAEVVLRNLPLDSAVELRLPLQDVGQIVAKGHVKASVSIKCNDHLFTVVKSESSCINSAIIKNSKDPLQMEVSLYELPEALVETFLSSALVSEATRLNWSLLRDHLYDVAMLASMTTTFRGRSLQHMASRPLSDAQRLFVIKNRRMPDTAEATRIDFTGRSRDCVAFPMQDKYNIILVTETTSHHLNAPSDLQQWAWLRAFHRISKIDPTEDASRSVKMSGVLDVFIKDGMKSCKCTIASSVVKGRTSYELQCEIIETSEMWRLTLDGLISAYVAYDYNIIHPYEFVVEIVSGRFKAMRDSRLTSSETHRSFSTSRRSVSNSFSEDSSPRVAAVDDFYTIPESDGAAETDRYSEPDEAGSSAVIIDDNTRVKKSGWYPGRILKKTVLAGTGRVVHTVVGTAKAATNVATNVVVQTGASAAHLVGGAVDVAVGLTSTGVGVVKGAAIGVVKGAQTGAKLVTGEEDVGHVANRLAKGTVQTIKSAGNTGLSLAQGKIQNALSYVVLQSYFSPTFATKKQLGTNPFWNETVTISMSEQQVREHCTSPSKGLWIHLFQGEEDIESITGSSFIPFQALIPRSLENSIRDKRPILDERLAETALHQTYVPVGSHSTSLKLTLISGHNFSTPPPVPVTEDPSSSGFSMFSASNMNSRSIQIKVKLTKWSGHDRGNRHKRHRSKVISDSLNPVWNQEMEFTSDDGHDWAQFVRLEVIDTKREIDKGGRLGAAFIPVDSIPIGDPLEVEVPVTPHRTIPANLLHDYMRYATENANNLHEAAVIRKNPLGYLKVTASRAIINNPPMGGGVILRSQLRKVDARSSFWRAKSLLVGSLSISDASKNTEDVEVYAAFEGLMVTFPANSSLQDQLKLFTLDASMRDDDTDHRDDSDWLSPFSKRKSTSSAASVDITKELQQEEHVRSQYGYIVEVFCFENQRQELMPPYSWSAKNLLPLERPWLSDESGTREFPAKTMEECPPPTGFQWLDESWSVEKDPTQTDENGWSYAVDFAFMMSRYKKRESSPSPDNCSVRRRRWGRFARRFAYPRSGINSIDQNSGTSIAYDTMFFSGASLNREAEFNRNRDGSILCLCRERGASKSNGDVSGPVIIPWTKVINYSVITPSVFSIVVEVNRYFGMNGTKENFVSAQCEIFVVGCPSADLSMVVQERISLAEHRTNTLCLVASGHIDGFDGKMNEGAAKKSTIEEAVDLSQGAQTMLELETSIATMDERLAVILKNKAAGSALFDQVASRATRLRLYQRLLLEAQLKGSPTTVEGAIESFNKYKLVAAQFYEDAISRGATPLSAAMEQVNFLMDTFESKISNFSLCAFANTSSTKSEAFEMMINKYYLEVIRVLGVFCDSMARLEMIQGNVKKLELISFIVGNDERFSVATGDALRPFKWNVSPQPRLSMSLEVNSVIGWYSVLLHKEMKQWVDRCLESSKLYDKNQHDLNPMFRFGLPWEPISTSVSGGHYLSHLRVTLIGCLKIFLEIPRPARAPQNSPEMLLALDSLDRAIVSAYGTCFLYVASQIRSILTSREWAAAPEGVSPSDEQAVYDSISGQMVWVCSAANDCLFYSAHVSEVLAAEAVELERERRRSGRMNYKVRSEAIDSISSIITETSKAFESNVKVCVDYLSSIIFTSVSSILVDQLNEEWRKECQLNSDQEASDPDFNDKSRAINVVLTSLATDFESYKEFLNPEAYVELVRIVSDKFVLRYYALLKTLELRKASFLERQLSRFSYEISRIIKCLRKAIIGSPDEEMLTNEIIQKFARLTDANDIIFHESDSDDFMEAVQKIKTIAMESPLSAHALAGFLKTCVTLRQDGPRLLQMEQSVIPLLCRQIQSYAVQPPPVVTVGQYSKEAELKQDFETIARLAFDEAKNHPLRPSPLHVVFQNESLWNMQGSVATAATNMLKSALNVHKSDVVINESLLNSRITALLNQTRPFYAKIPRDKLPAGANDHFAAISSIVETTAARRSSLNAAAAASSIAAVKNVASSSSSSSGGGDSLGNYLTKFKGFFSTEDGKHPPSPGANQGSSSGGHPEESLATVSASRLMSMVKQGIGAAPTMPLASLLDSSSMADSSNSYIEIREITVANLFTIDTFMSSKANVYVKIQLSAQTVLTSVIANTLRPEWKDQHLKLFIPEGLVIHESIVCTVYYKKRIGSDDMIGTVSIPMAKLSASGSIDETFDLNLSNSSDHVISCSVKASAEGFAAPTLTFSAVVNKSTL